jgi:hypothetical protein
MSTTTLNPDEIQRDAVIAVDLCPKIQSVIAFAHCRKRAYLVRDRKRDPLASLQRQARRNRRRQLWLADGEWGPVVKVYLMMQSRLNSTALECPWNAPLDL